MVDERAPVAWFSELSAADTEQVGGKNASLGEMISKLSSAGIRVPDGFATTASAYWEFVDRNDLRERIAEQIDRLHDGADLTDVGERIRDLFLDADLGPTLRHAVGEAYRELAARLDRSDPPVAVRSSATAEDLPEASFAGQQESFLDVSGVDDVLDACQRCFASLFTDRAINYREDQGFDHRRVALSVGVQEMVRADAAGVMFTIDTETGFPHTVLVNAASGLGEGVVGGEADPDEYVVFKPLLGSDGARPIIFKRAHTEGGAGVLDDDEILELARAGVVIEDHYGRPMDVEWARDGETGEIEIVQARPETAEANREAGALRSYRLTESGERLVSGLAIGDRIAAAPVCRLDGPDQIDRFVDGSVLVTAITDPDWEPIMKRAAAIVTDHGGRTSHAAIVSRELGLAAIVGTADATQVLDDARDVTVSCAEGDEGHVYDGILGFEEHEIDLAELAETRTDVMLNVGDPSGALRWWRLPADGVGLARIEFIVADDIEIHPMALAHFDEVRDEKARELIEERTRGYEDRGDYFVEQLSSGIARIAASRWPDPVLVRLSDLKTNEYARLVGGADFEPEEENPMLGWRGASRYADEGYRDGFALECRAILRVRDEIGLDNVVVMIPFCRTVVEADRVLETMSAHGLVRGRNGLEVYVMAEIPSNVILAEEFAARFDGFSIGSNDLTQLVLGVDRDSRALAHLFDESNEAVTRSIESLITTAHRSDRKVGLCGQRPSDDPEFASFLVQSGIDSISVTPDSFLRVKEHVVAAEEALDRRG